MSAHPGVSFTWSLRSTALSAMHISGKELHVILHQGIFTKTDVANEVSISKVVLRLTASYSMPTVTLYSQSDVCHQDSTLKPLVITCTLFCVQVFASRVSGRCKRDVGALSWLNAETVKRAPTPLFGRLVRCFAHGPFYVRLWY